MEEIVPFSSLEGKKVLEVGCGVGYDAYDFCSHGARYVGIDITPENVERCRNHLEYFGLEPMVIVGDAEFLPCSDGSVDVVFSNGVLHHTPDIGKSFREANRVLCPQGEFWVILYHKNSIFHWISVVLFDYLLTFKFLQYTYSERLSMIEYTTSSFHPLVKVFSKRSVRSLLTTAGFLVDQMWVRKLTTEDLPNFPLFRHVWRRIPQGWLNWASARWGWYLIAKATKRPSV
ncbi:MAG: class I SAM-dependent methyltransferase [Bacteroidota bacterium]